MSNKKEEQAVIGRAMMEPDFRARLLSNPEKTLKDEHLNVSPELLQQLKSMDKKVADQVGRVIGAMFGQKEAPSMSEDELDKVAGGGISFQNTGIQGNIPSNLQNISNIGGGGVQLPPVQAPTTW